MTQEEARLRIAALSEELEQHNYNYYILAKPTISDYEFDMKLEELARLEKEFPEYLSPTSPTQRVGGGITKEFQSVKHRYPMLSLANSYSREEIADFISRIKKTIEEEVEFCCELKFDGLSISLQYENGVLVRAVTRGELVTMLYKYAQYKQYSVSDSEELSAFPDNASLPSWAKSAMEWAVGTKLISGIEGSLSADTTATRSQAAKVLTYFMEMYEA